MQCTLPTSHSSLARHGVQLQQQVCTCSKAPFLIISCSRQMPAWLYISSGNLCYSAVLLEVQHKQQQVGSRCLKRNITITRSWQHQQWQYRVLITLCMPLAAPCRHPFQGTSPGASESSAVLIRALRTAVAAGLLGLLCSTMLLLLVLLAQPLMGLLQLLLLAAAAACLQGGS